MGYDAEDISLAFRPHPALFEIVKSPVEAFEGTIADLYLLKRP